MRSNKGFSLTEVLVSLLLVTGTATALLGQQWHASQFLNQTLTRNRALWQLDNASERLQFPPEKTNLPFVIHSRENKLVIDLMIDWDVDGIFDFSCSELKRQVVVR